MAGRMEFEFTFRGQKRAPSFGSGEAKLRILLAGDFSGRGGRGASEPTPDLARRPLLRIDLDSFDQVMAKLAPRLVLAPAVDDRPPDTLAFAALDDFHPDRLCQRLEVFAGFRALRERLLDPGTFAQAAAALEPAAPQAAPAVPADTLERLLGGRPKVASEGGDIGAFLQKVVAPHITPAPDARQPRLVAAVDEAAGHHLRGLLHAPAFQELEAAWRAAHRLVSSVEEETSVFLLDVSRLELMADLAGNPDGSGLHRRLTEPAASWSLLVVDETFGAGPEDVALLSALGAVAAQVGAPVLAAADPHLDWSALDGEAAARWQSLRQSPQASAIGLALPRWLLRLPYGEKTDAIESFPFEELTARTHEHYLWGNPAIACALLAAAAFRQNGADMQLGDVLELDDLPAHTYREDGEAHLQPCAEVFMPERVSTALIGRGLMPFVSARDRNSARLARFQSIADPAKPLIGPWG